MHFLLGLEILKIMTFPKELLHTLIDLCQFLVSAVSFAT